jgi:amidase
MTTAEATSSAADLVAAIRSKEISARELLETYLERIDRLDRVDRDGLNAVVTLDADRALAAAKLADDALARGDDIGPLHGLPMTIKDAIATEGIRSTGGAVELTDYVPAADAPAVARLKAAGAILFGKTNLPRWCGDAYAHNELFGVTHNPWSPAHVPGGSSGGSAAALAAGLTGAELGTDIGGSVRAPAHCCGVYALKPSYGVVPNLGYLDHVDGGTTRTDLNTFGPMARAAGDLDLLVSVLAGPAPEDSLAWRVDLPASEVTSLSGLRVATWLDDETCPVDREYLGLLRGAADAFADAGAKVEAAHPGGTLREPFELYVQLIAAAVSPSMPEEMAERVSGSHLAWLRNDEERAALRAQWAEWFESYDVLLLPAWCMPAFGLGHTGGMIERWLDVNGELRTPFEISQWLMLVNLVHLPSVMAPIGRTAAGLPVGMQIVAPYLRDRRAIRVAELLGEVAGGYEVPPGFQ